MRIDESTDKRVVKPIDKDVYQKGITEFEKALSAIPGSFSGHECDESLCPLKHTFVDGAYIREIFMPKGLVLTSKIHKVTHPYFVMSGSCSVLTETGIQRIQAPYYGVTVAGTKRLLQIHEDTVWVTIHVTKETDLDKIEEQIIAKDFNDPALNHAEYKMITKGV
jgi:hypothetical protein